MNIVKKLIIPAVLGLSMVPLSGAMAETSPTASLSNQAVQMNQLAYYGCHRRCYHVKRCWNSYHGYHCRWVPVCRSWCRHWYY